METLITICGWVGTFLIVWAYYLVSNGKISVNSSKYQWLNFVGSVAIGVHVVYQKAWAAVALEVIWCAIAVAALLRLKMNNEQTGS